jgi:KRAB domain-containing zinc finger protein
MPRTKYEVSEKGNLVRAHKETQTRDKPYERNICDKRFSQSNNLAAHNITHIEDKLYECDVCNKTFSRAWYLSILHS